jgi:isocitrate/isopropylmalate dehydrogenase
MATSDLSKETEKKLLDFFNNVIDAKDLAKAIRQLNYAIALVVMREDESGYIYSQKENLEKGFYWLNELAEILHPYLEVE